MRQKIKQQAKHLGYEISDRDVDHLINKYAVLLATDKISAIRSAIKAYFD